MKSISWIIVFFSIALLFGCGDQHGKTSEMDIATTSDSVRHIGSQIDSTLLNSQGKRDALLSGRIHYSLPYSARKGKRLFRKYCVICHGESGRGDGFNAWNLQPRPRDLSDPDYLSALTDERIAEAIREGGGGVQKSNLMPAWGKTLSKTEIQQIVEYLRTLPSLQ